MGRFLLSRLVQIVVTMMVLVLITFIVVRVAPGSPAEVLLGPDQVSADMAADIEQRLGLHQSIPQQLLRWTGSVLRGDLGGSYFYREPAMEVVLDRLPATLILGASGMALAILLGVPAGIWAAARPGGWLDHAVRSFSVVVMSMPVFWIGIGLISLFSAQLGWLPSAGTGAALGDADIADRVRHLILPMLAMALPTAATLALYTRSSISEVLGADYLRTATSKGLSQRVVLWRHALRNAAIPVTVQIGLSLPHVLEGSVVIETVFSWPGIGQLTAASVGRRDYPVLLAVVLLVGISVLISSLLTDLAHRAIDPRLDLA